MAVRIQGDFGRLEDLAGRFGDLASDAQKRVLLEDLARKSRDLIGMSFLRSIDPYGTPWRPLKRPRPGGNKPLVDTGELRDSRRTYLLDSGFELRLAGHGLYHQTGTSRIPKRQIVPEGDPGPIWRLELERVVEMHMRRVMRWR